MTITYKPVFIVGHPRSGTTWMMWLLSQHPGVAASFHSGFFQAITPFEKWRRQPGSFGKFIIPGISAEHIETAERSSRQVLWQTALSGGMFNQQIREMVCELLDTIAAYGVNPKVVVENTPENLELMSWILDIIPEAHILHIIRDPRSLWLSIHNSLHSWMNPNRPGAFPSNLKRNILCWSRYLSTGRELQKRTENYCEIRYEDLQNDGVNELMRIFHWLELPAGNDFCEQALANSTLDKLKEVMPSPQGFFGKGRTDSWQEDLSNSEVKQIEYLAGEWMDTLGYERRFPAVSSPPWQLWVSDQVSRTANFLRRRLSRW